MASLFIMDSNFERSTHLVRELRRQGHEGIVLSADAVRLTLEHGFRPDLLVVRADDANLAEQMPALLNELGADIDVVVAAPHPAAPDGPPHWIACSAEPKTLLERLLELLSSSGSRSAGAALS